MKKADILFFSIIFVVLVAFLAVVIGLSDTNEFVIIEQNSMNFTERTGRIDYLEHNVVSRDYWSRRAVFIGTITVDLGNNATTVLENVQIFRFGFDGVRHYGILLSDFSINP